jgi:hypothetical protein
MRARGCAVITTYLVIKLAVLCLLEFAYQFWKAFTGR